MIPYHSSAKSNRQLQRAIRNFLKEAPWHISFGVTLHFKRCLYGIDGGLVEILNPYIATATVTQFLNLLNRQALGSAYVRHGRRLGVISVSEGDGDTGLPLHYHLQIECPRFDLESRMKEMIEHTWARMDWGNEVHAIPYVNDGWTTYITKLRSKLDIGEAIDWENTQLPLLS